MGEICPRDPNDNICSISSSICVLTAWLVDMVCGVVVGALFVDMWLVGVVLLDILSLCAETLCVDVLLVDVLFLISFARETKVTASSCSVMCAVYVVCMSCGG